MGFRAQLPSDSRSFCSESVQKPMPPILSFRGLEFRV